jgi:phosphate transport system substrate-binding protein
LYELANMNSGLKYILILFISLLFSGCFGNYQDRIRIDGSSTLFPLSEAVAEDFRKLNPEIKITVGVSGTSGGIRKFIRNEIDIADASRKMNEAEKLECETLGIEYLELPVSNDGIVIAVHPENSFIDYLTVSELKKIWEPSAQKKILFWDQIRPNWPHVRIQLFGAGTSSGSFDFFTQKIVGIRKASRGDYTASEDDNMLVQGVSGAKNALGFFGYSYYKENAQKLKLVAIDDEINENGLGAILANEENIKNGTYQPLSRTEYIYINKKSLDRKIVQEFVLFYITNSNKLIDEIAGIKLNENEYNSSVEMLNNYILEHAKNL